MKTNFKEFIRCQSGSVTTDWLVLAAAIILMGMIVVTSVFTGADAVVLDISTTLSDSETGV